MIRTIKIPRGVSRMGSAPGSVGMGAGGSYTAYSFDATGLSNDPALASYMQDLTPAQLQSALNNADPTPGLSALLIDEATGTGAGYLPSGAAQTTTSAFGSVPTWALVAGAGVLGLLLVRR